MAAWKGEVLEVSKWTLTEFIYYLNDIQSQKNSQYWNNLSNDVVKCKLEVFDKLLKEEKRNKHSDVIENPGMDLEAEEEGS